MGSPVPCIAIGFRRSQGPCRFDYDPTSKFPHTTNSKGTLDGSDTCTGPELIPSSTSVRLPFPHSVARLPLFPSVSPSSSPSHSHIHRSVPVSSTRPAILITLYSSWSTLVRKIILFSSASNGCHKTIDTIRPRHLQVGPTTAYPLRSKTPSPEAQAGQTRTWDLRQSAVRHSNIWPRAAPPSDNRKQIIT